jgi:predicted outer membrane repeat protein
LTDTFTVTNTSDSGAGSLREAIAEANANAGADEIQFADSVSGTITLGSQLPSVTDDAGLVIDGGGDVKVSGNHAVAVLEVGVGARLTLQNLTVADGSADDHGAGVVNGGFMEVTNSTFSDNSAISDNLYSSATVTNSTFSDNSSSFGGAIYMSEGGTTTVSNTIIANTTNGDNCLTSDPDATLGHRPTWTSRCVSTPRTTSSVAALSASISSSRSRSSFRCRVLATNPTRGERTIL